MKTIDTQKFIIIMQNKEGDTPYDTFCGAFNTIEEANEEAITIWKRLTAREKSQRTVDVFIVKREWINEDAIDEEGNIDWAGYSIADRNESCFDSETFNDREDNEFMNKIIEKVMEIIKDYENQPKISFDENQREIYLNGGNYSARQDVEDYLNEQNMVECVNNQPNSKTIRLEE